MNNQQIVRWQDLAWTEIEQTTRQRPIAVLAIGALEAHGPHLALGTDNFVAEGLAERLVAQLDAILLPPVLYGQVWSLRRFTGTLGLKEDTLQAVLFDIAADLHKSGVGGFVIINAHVGNSDVLKRVARAAFDASLLPILPLTYTSFSKTVNDQVRTSPASHGAVPHAEEIETSVTLALAPEAVDMEKARAEYPDYPDDFMISPMYWDEISETAVFGDPTAATAEKGRLIVDYVLEKCLETIRAWRSRTGI